MEILDFLAQNLWWILLVIMAILIFAGAWVANFAYDSYAEKLEKALGTRAGFAGTIVDFANTLSMRFFDGKIRTTIAPSDVNDGFYSPSAMTITLSPKVARTNSIGGIAVVAHEFGHAAQQFQNPNILINNHRLNKFVKFLGNFNWVIVIGTILACIFAGTIWALVGVGLLMVNVFVAILLKYSTLRLEKNASVRAMKMLEELNFFSPQEIGEIKKFLGFAKRTYTADLLAAILGWTGLVRKTKFF